MTGKCFVHRQGPLAETSDVGEKEPISPFPTVMYGFFYQERYHTCAARHPCNMNGALFCLFSCRHLVWRRVLFVYRRAVQRDVRADWSWLHR